MKITKINIYGFGKWTNVSWDLTGEGIQLIFGHNEAGKSTFMSFIFAILFGFPKRGENQYFPKGKEEYGGSITIESERFGEVVIERTKSRRVKGDVSVYFSDGTVKGEEALQQILQEIDEKTFQGIFYFDLDGLNFNAMNPMQLNEFLYDTTIAGSKSITQLEKSLQTEMEKLFKPRGQKTEMNVLANELMEKEQQMDEWRHRLDQYDVLVQKVKTLENNLQEKKEELTSIEEKSKAVSKYEWLQPLAKEWHKKKLSLAEREKIDFFPENGVERLEQLNESLMEKEIRQKEEKLKWESTQEEIEKISLHDEWPILKEDVQQCLQQYDFVQKWTEEMNDYELDILQYSRQKEKLQNRWTEQILNDSLLFSKIPFTPLLKKTYGQLKERWQDCLHWTTRIREDLARVTQQVKQKEKELHQLEKERLTEEERVKYEKIVERQSNNEDEFKLEMFTERLVELEKERDKKEKGEKRQQGFLYLFSVIMLAFTVVSFIWTDGFVPFMFTGLMFAVVFFTYWKKRDGDKELRKINHSISEVREKIFQLESKLNEHRHVDLSMYEQMLERDRSLTVNYDMKIFERNSLLEQKLELERQLEEYEEMLEKIKEDILQWCQDNRLPKSLDFSLFESLLQDLEQWHQLDEQEHHVQQKYKQLKNRYVQYEQKVIQLCKKLSQFREEDSLAERVRALKQFLQEGLNKEKEKIKLEEKLKFGREAFSRIQLEIDELNKKRKQLLKSSGAASEEEFRHKAILYETQIKLEEKIVQLFVQMKQVFSEDEEQLNEAIHQLLYEQFDPVKEQYLLQQERERIDAEMEDIRNEIANVKKEIAILEEDGTYDELKLQFTQLREELQSYAKRWSTFAVAKGMIEEVKKVYEEVRQPYVLKEGERIFSQLTEGEYIHLYAPLGEERFIVERKDGIRFEPYELSRGTCELLYLSLRLALANIYRKKQEPFPLLIDEAFVNIDKNRRKNIVQVLREIAKERQVILFTCHEHIKMEFAANEVLL